MEHLVTPAGAAALIAVGAIVLDVQYNLVGTPGRELYAAGHIPGAPFLDLDLALAGAPGKRGRHPLPDAGVLQKALRECGVLEGEPVVVYDQDQSFGAARAWWTLRWAGIDDVRVIDGGLAAWARDGHPVTTEMPAPERGDVVVDEESLLHLTAEEAYDLAQGEGLLFDARTHERWLGETEPIDRIAGRVPGAVNLPMALAMEDDGRFRSPEEIRALAQERGWQPGTPVATMCGSGVTAVQLTLALAHAGIDSVPYIGGWSEWIEDPSRPIATGPAS